MTADFCIFHVCCLCSKHNILAPSFVFCCLFLDLVFCEFSGDRFCVGTSRNFAIVRACYTMENGLNDKNGKKMGKTWKICPDRKWEKMAENCRKNGKLARFSIFSVFFGHFSHFRSGQIVHVFPIFSHFCRSARFPLYSRPARLQS